MGRIVIMSLSTPVAELLSHWKPTSAVNTQWFLTLQIILQESL